MQRTSLLAMLVVAGTGVAAAAPKGLTIQDMLAMQRVGEPHVSPDGTRVAFAVRDTDYDANRGRFDIFIAKIDRSGVVSRRALAVLPVEPLGLVAGVADRARRRRSRAGDEARGRRQRLHDLPRRQAPRADRGRLSRREVVRR